MADILSQEEIDRLLSAAATDTAPSEPAGLKPGEVEPVEKLTSAFFASANAVLATLLARPVSVLEGLGQTVSLADLEGTAAFAAVFPFRSGFTGDLAFVMRHRDASVLADLILGGEGLEKEALEDSDLDALKEAFTHVARSGASPLSVAIGREVAFAPPRCEEVRPGGLSVVLPWGTAFLATGSIRVEGVFDAPLRLLLPMAIARELARLCKKEPEEVRSPERPAPKRAAAPEPQRTEAATEMRNIELILDIEVEVMVRLGGVVMPLRDIQKLRPGSIMDLDRDTEAPVELVVNDRVIAKGELVVVGSDHFALRITEIETPTERIRKLGA
jgi:flagellar motor switch protein FliN